MARKKKKFIVDLLFPLIRLWAASWRFRGEIPAADPCIMLLWHEELFPVLKAGSQQNWIGIISPSRDGDYLERLITPWGYRSLRGSASVHEKATRMLRETIRLAKHNKLTIGVDGPRGPRREVKIGMLMAAQKSGAPIYLVRARARGFRIDKAWDKSLIPCPFARVEIRSSGPFVIDRSLDREGLEALAVEIGHRLDRLGGDDPLNPA